MTETHLQDDELEEYILGILPPARLDPVEEHILFCSACLDRAEEIESFILAARQAMERKPN
jgi:anti-sigma factor RsiW